MAIPKTLIHPRPIRSQVPNAVWVQTTEVTWNLRRTVNTCSHVLASTMRFTDPTWVTDAYRIGMNNRHKHMTPMPDSYETLEEAMHVAEMLYLTGAYD